MKSILSTTLLSNTSYPSSAMALCLEITDRSPNLLFSLLSITYCFLDWRRPKSETRLSVSNYFKISYEILKTNQCNKRML